MSGSQPTRKAVQFGAFELDSHAGELHKHGIRIKLQKQPLQVLTVLIEHAGDVVTKEELRQRLWPSDTFVDFDHGLHSAITRLREALGDSSESSRFIETVPRRGYCFIAPVAVIGNGSEAVAEGKIAASVNRFRRFRASIPGLVLGALVLTLLLGLNLGGFRRWLLRASNPAIQSLAVLPLQNLSGDPEYFVDGMTDALITELSKIRAFRVISRTSTAHYKGTRKSLPEIARELNVDGIVEGSVLRSGTRVRIAAELIYAATDQHLWAETYERELSDVLKLQGEVAQTIAQQVRVRVSRQEAAGAGSPGRVNPEAYEAYLRGRYFWNLRTEAALWKSAELFQQAIGIDPESALPYVGIADAYLVLDGWTVEAVPHPQVTLRAEAAVRKALALDPTLAEAPTVLAGLHAGNWDWQASEAEFRRAIELNPNYAHAHQWYSQLLTEMGRFEEGVAEAAKAHALDPLNLMFGIDVGYRLYWARRYKEAGAPIQKTLELEPNFPVAHRFLGQVYEQDSRYDAAISELQRAAQLSSNNPIDLGALGHAYAVSGQPARARQILRELQALSSKRYVSAYQFALVYTGLGEREQAAHWLEKAFQEHSGWMLHLKVDPRLDPLRSDPRFQGLLRRVGLE